MLCYRIIIAVNDIKTPTFATMIKRAGQCFAEKKNEAPFRCFLGLCGLLPFLLTARACTNSLPEFPTH